ncbi:MAG: tRNA pseudouridine(38-40) synthase TruA [Culturomica sp.]|jgi:tRNA pseudouridine38-40 synthase|nr:tRNA pseudouridine(38-40) synthase TruA [Culturomica sp.]
MRCFIELSYNGTTYNGWQQQPNAPSVQEDLTKAVATLLRRDIQIVGAGRTDTGVHAHFYVAHFNIDEPIDDSDNFVYKLNRILGDAIAVSRIYTVADGMHARFSAVSRTYKYFINKSKNPFTCEYAVNVHPLPDIALMNEACKILFEYEDFTSFSKLHTDVKNNICRIISAEWQETDEQLIFTIKANRFLRNMVRAIVGTMIEVGQKKITTADFRHIIEVKNRCEAGTSVPGKALFLWDIEY